MWTRKQLKERARASFYRNRWRTVLVSLVAVAFLGAAGYAGSTLVGGRLGVLGQKMMEDSAATESELKMEGRPEKDSGVEPGSRPDETGTEDAGNGDGYGAEDSGMGGGYEPEAFEGSSGYGEEDFGASSGMAVNHDGFAYEEIVSSESSPSYAMAFSVVVILLAMLGLVIVAVLVLVVVALIVNPLLVGCRRFFFINLNTSARVGELGYGFDTDYRNIVRVMLDKTIYTILWSLLFLVPGVVKNYEYMMVPYILAEEPGIDRKRAFAISREMMKGNKGKAFVLDVSFVPWYLLSGITAGIVGVFYVNPYKNMTYAAFYEQMRSNYTQKRMAYTQQDFSKPQAGNSGVWDSSNGNRGVMGSGEV